MPLDPQAKTLLDAIRSLPPVATLSVQQARDRFRSAFSTKREPEPMTKVEDRTISGPDSEIPLRIYTPNKEKKLPVLLFFHGGGGVVGCIDTHDAVCRTLGNSACCIVESVEYRLAPEHKYPAGLQDCYAAAKWVSQNAALINADPARIAVGGDSAGGSLAAGVALLARDRGGPKLVYQLMFYPMTDYYVPDTASYQQDETECFLDSAAIEWFMNHYLPNSFDRDDPYLFPLRSKDLSRLPSALIMTAEYDLLRDQGEMCAMRLEEAGVSVHLQRVEGMTHGFTVMAGRLDKGKNALIQAEVQLKEAFRNS